MGFYPTIPTSPLKEQRPRRRLKKKSRPGQSRLGETMDGGIFELQERVAVVPEGEDGDGEEDLPASTSLPLYDDADRPITPSVFSAPLRPSTPPVASVSAAPMPIPVAGQRTSIVQTNPPVNPPSSPRSGALLSRMGSLKRHWAGAVRRNRSSTGPPQPPPMIVPPSSPSKPNGGWFQRLVVPATLPVGVEEPPKRSPWKSRSRDRLATLKGDGPNTEAPSVPERKVTGRSRSNTTGSVPDRAILLAGPHSRPATPGRLSSFQPPPSSPLSGKFPETNGEAHHERKSSVKLQKSPSQKDNEGRRGFMGGVRRISLVGGGHRKNRSLGGGVDDPPGLGEPEKRQSEKVGVPLVQLVPSESGEPSITPPVTTASSASLGKPYPTPLASASLGRATSNVSGRSGQSGHSSSGEHKSPAARRSSLGDLKIPSRIRNSQNGIKRDLATVKEFAAVAAREFFFLATEFKLDECSYHFIT